MKRLFFGALPIIAVAALLSTAAGTKDDEQFGDLVNRFYQAWSTLDVEQAAPFYAKEADLRFFDLAPLKYDHGWKEYSDNFKTNVAPTFASLKLTPNPDLKVIRKRDIALVTLTFHVDAKMKDGSAMNFEGRHTLFLEKRGGKWLVLHEHVSKPL
jgi:ketosteroid isomerase-like protein